MARPGLRTDSHFRGRKLHLSKNAVNLLFDSPHPGRAARKETGQDGFSLHLDVMNSPWSMDVYKS